MATGWNLKIGEAKNIYLTETDLWRYTQLFLMNATHTTNYKYILMKALLECVVEVNPTGKITFMQIAYHVTKIYWNLIVKYNLRQINGKKVSTVEKVMKDFQQQYHIPSDWVFDRLSSNHQVILMESINKVFKKYVYGSFYVAFDKTIYSFNLKEEWIVITPPYNIFFQKYKRILMNATNYQLALFLEKYNSAEAMQHILSKLEMVSMRESLIVFKEILEQYGLCNCFYCKKDTSKMHVDHFIPWSYMQNDVLWNFVLACQTCNTSKNNKLAHKDYLHSLLERNNEWTTLAYEDMETYQEQKLIHLYDYAIQNGFQSDWKPRT